MMKQNLLLAAKELKRFIDQHPVGAMIDPALKCDVRSTETYRIASLAISTAEAEIAAQAGDFADSP